MLVSVGRRLTTNYLVKVLHIIPPSVRLACLLWGQEQSFNYQKIAIHDVGLRLNSGHWTGKKNPARGRVILHPNLVISQVTLCRIQPSNPNADPNSQTAAGIGTVAKISSRTSR